MHAARGATSVRTMHPILVPFHLDEHLPGLDSPLAPTATIAPELPDGDVWERLAALYAPVAECVAKLVASGTPPVVMSGDCTTSLGVVAGLQRAGLDPAVVWFDAHGDLQTLETTTSGYLGGFPLRILAGYRPELISARLGLAPVPEDLILLVDGRDLDPPERDFLAGSPIRHLAVDELSARELPAGPIYLHVDLDVVNPDEVPGQLFPARGGPSLAAVAAAVARVVHTGRVAAVGLGCTWRPGGGAAAAVREVVEVLGSGAPGGNCPEIRAW